MNVNAMKNRVISVVKSLKMLVFLCCIYSETLYALDQGVLLAAQNMLNQGQSVEALDLLDPLETEYAGNREYDYLYGLALLDTGEASSAVFAFQRALAVEPNFAGARLELARSYFDMGQMQRASREFQVLQGQSPPQNVRNVIDKYLAAIESRNLRSRRGWRGFVQLGLGNDTNVNNATTATSFIGFDLDDDSRETESSVISTLGGASYDLPLSFDSKMFFKGSVNHRANNDASFTSTINYDLAVGYSTSFLNRNELSIALQTYTADVDGTFNNKGVNFTGQYSFNISSLNQVGFFLRTGIIDYASEFNVKDIAQNITGLNWAHVFSGESRISMVISAIAGQDEPDLDTSKYGRDFTGMRISLAFPLSHRFNLFVSMGKTQSDYELPFNNQFSENRSDTIDDFSIGSNWRINKTWVLRGIVGVTESTSNVDLFDYEKTVLMFSARSEFLP